MASKTRNFFLNAIALTLTALIMRGVGLLFNILVSNRAGSEAMGLFSLLGSVNGFAVTLAAAGINLGTTRMVSEALGKNDPTLARKAVKRALIHCLVTGGIASLLLFLTAPFLGKTLLGDARAILPLRILSLSLIPISVCSCLSGYFTAVRRVKINSFLQILIQLSKIAVTLFLLSFMVDLGTEEACTALVAGGTVAELLSLLITYILYRIDLKKIPKDCEFSSSAQYSISKALIGITLPVTFSACARSLLTMLQHILVPRGLGASGASWEEALSAYGALHGMAMPIILFPSAFISAFAGLLIPEVSEFCVQNNESRLARSSYRAMTLSLIFSIGVSGIMIFFSKQLGMLIYGSEEVARYIRIMAPLIPVMYIDSATDAILKGSGHQVFSMNVNIIDALTACILALTLIPSLGIWGYVISIYATEILNTTLSLCKMITISKMRIRIGHQVIMPILCIIGATNIAAIILSLTKHPFGSVVELILHILLTLTLYLVLLLFTHTIGKDETEFLNASLLSEKSYNKRFRTAHE